MKKRFFMIAKNCAATALILLAASALCFLLQGMTPTDTHVPLIFVLAVLCVSRFTSGYLYGIVASVLAVVGVNFVFTYPYFELNFTITGYPLTFIVMFSVSLIVSALTTQIKKQEELRLLAEREKMRGNLLRAVSHDIRTPLTSIVGSASAILDNYDRLPDGEKKELLENIRQEAQWLSQIEENILSVTRITGEAAKLSMSLELAEEVVSSAAMKYRKRRPDCVVTVDVPEEPLLLPMDPILIEQVLINLLDNAAVHGRQTNEITVLVRKESEKAVFSVSDDGVGIPPELLPHLFDGTLPLTEKDADARGGMRIGLSVCMSIVKAHRGTMYAENRKEGGARVSFEIPLEEK